MKVHPFTIPKPRQDALIFQEDRGLAFYELLHQHEEFQLSYIKEGHGALMVGDTVNFYQPGDVIVLGGNLPHVFKSDIIKSRNSHMLTIFSTEKSFGREFFQTEELKELKTFFKKSENGFKIFPVSKEIIDIFEKFHKISKLDRFIQFFRLLLLINNAKYESLSSFISEKKYSENEGRRMSAVIEYTMKNFRKEIPLDVIAREAAMTKNAFCKYFKKRTRKTYITFLNELRIEEACKLLQVEDGKSIAEIAELSGFQNISNFNRKFKQIKNITPSALRSEIH